MDGQVVLLKSHAQVKQEFDRRGWTVRGWAAKHGLSEHVVYEVMRGRFKGRRGQAHKAAVLLGLKDGVVGDEQ